MIEIKLLSQTGDFAENKDLAKEIRQKQILPAVEKGEEVVLNFQGVNSATQSFIHALISDVIRQNGIEAIDKLFFKNCEKKIQTIISIVIDYVQDSISVTTQ